MAKTSDRQIVNGETYLIMDTEARAAVAAETTAREAAVEALSEEVSDLKGELEQLDRSVSKEASGADNYWIEFPIENGKRIKVTNKGANTITAIGATSENWGSNIQTFGDLGALSSAVYTCTVDNAEYIHFWATGATSVLIEDYEATIPQIVDSIDKNADDIAESNVCGLNTYDKISISSSKQYFTVVDEKDGQPLKESSPLELSSSTAITEIEIYRKYKTTEIGTGKTLYVGSKTCALYGTTQPSAAVWNAVLFKSANYNGETYNGQDADYFIQYNGTNIQIMHVLAGGESELYKQSVYGTIINLEIPMEVVQVNSTAINIKNAIPESANDVIIADIDKQALTFISSGDVVYAKGATTPTYARYIDILGKATINRIGVISGAFKNGVVRGDQVGFISVYDVRNSSKAYISGYVFNGHDYYDLLNSEFEVISYLNNSSGSWIEIGNYEVDVTEAAYLCVSNNNNASIVKVEGNIKSSQESGYIANKTNSYWGGRVVAWLGTSIPASGEWDNESNTASYPIKLARELGFTCHNLAVGGSCVHCKSPERISESNPYGFANDYLLCAKCVTNTVEEMEWLIENYDSSIFTINRQSSISADLAAHMIALSYENLLPKLFNYSPDLVVINYGWNDGGLTLEQDLELIEEYGENNLYCYTGAMNFLLRKIFENDPHQAVAMVGEIREHPMNEHEEYVAGQWLIPFYDLYNKCGFSSKQIKTTGYWDNEHRWVESGGEERTVYVYQTWLYDDIHPHSSMDGRALARITKCLVPFFMNDLRSVLEH